MRSSSILAVATLFLGCPTLLAQGVTQEAYVKPGVVDASSNGDAFGSSIAVSGDTAVVGAPFEDGGTTGVNGDQSDNSQIESGAAYVFVRTASGWTQQAYLKPSTNIGGNPGFGRSVAIDGDTIVIGAPGESSASTGVNGDEENSGAQESGAVYVFVRDAGTWTQQAYLKASNTDAFDEFGFGVAISDDRILVGARGESSAATGVNGDESSNTATISGAAYVFARVGSTWTQQAYLKATNTGSFDFFGSEVAISGDTIAVSAPFETSDATGINGSQGGGAPISGAVYVFKDNGAGWLQQAYVKASNTETDDAFGHSIALEGDTLAVGAPGEDSQSAGIDGDQGNNAAPRAGAVYVFERVGPTWSQSAYIKTSNPDTTDRLGATVSLSGDFLALGAFHEASDADGVGGDQLDNTAAGAGAVYLFARDAGSWAQQAYIKASNSDANDVFASAAVSGASLIVGAWGEDGPSAGINGVQDNTGPIDIGAAYAFDLSGVARNAWSDQGGALFGAAGNPLLLGSGSLYAGSDNSVDLSNAATSAFTGLFIGLVNNPTPFKGGMLKPVPWLKLAFTNTTPGGTLALPFAMPFGVPSGTELWVQVAITDAGAPVGVAISNAVKGVTP